MALKETLRIDAAAHDGPEREALILCRLAGPTATPLNAAPWFESYSYRELAERVAQLRLAESSQPLGAPRQLAALLATSELATCVAIYAALEGGVPQALFHPEWTHDEAVRAQTALEEAPSGCHGDLVVFTSGTTGTAHGVWLSGAGLEASALASERNLGWQDDDRWLAPLSLAHVGGLSVLTRCLAGRRTAVIAPPTADGGQLAALIAHHRITVVSLVPAQLARLLTDVQGWSPPSHLRAVLLGGAPTPAWLLELAATRGVPFLTSYGMTETSAQIVCSPYATRGIRSARGIGKPLPGVHIAIEEGVIIVEGPMVATHGLAGPLATTPWGGLITKDRGRLDSDGNLVVSGRVDDLINVAGEKIDPGEIEEVAQRCLFVKEACAYGVDDPIWGHSIALAVVASDPPLETDALWDELKRKLSHRKVPRIIHIVHALPRNAGGKVVRNEVARSTATLALCSSQRPADRATHLATEG